MKPLPKKHYHSDPLQTLPAAELAALQAVSVTTVRHDDDGMLVQTMRIPPGGSLAAPLPASGGGQFFLVTAGVASVAGKAYGQWSCFWAAHTDAALELNAGLGGAEVLLAQCPRADYQPTFSPDFYKYPD